MNTGARLPDDLVLGPVHLTVADAERSLAFYRDLMGLSLLAEEEGELWMGPAGATLLVLRENQEAVRRPPNTTGLYHYALLVPDRPSLGAALQKLLAQEYPLQGAADHWVSEAVYLADPDGNGIEIYRDRPRSEWPRENGQLQMATEPLDVEAVLGAANSAGEPALPAGTTVGHVHLHVDDLAAALAFYQGALGFELTTRYGSSAAFLAAGGYHHHVGLNTWAGVGAKRPPEAAVGLRLFTIILSATSELGAVADRLAKLGVEYDVTSGWIETEDPAGNRLRLELAANGELP